MSSKITEEQIKYIIQVYPQAHGDNTEFFRRFIEVALDYRGLDLTWNNAVAMMKEYKPETIMRKRREYIDSTQQQKLIAENVKKNYSDGVPIDDILNVLEG